MMFEGESADEDPIALGETYASMAKAIAFMRENYLSQPSLKAIAQQVYLSEYHFQRLFTRWAGISPKRFLQYLTLDYAKAKLAETQNLLELSAAAGLSSPGRLHDLFVQLEAMSPGEYRSGGAGLTLWYGIHETLFGYCWVAKTPRGICNLGFLEQPDRAIAEAQLRAAWPQAQWVYDPSMTQAVGDRLLHPTVYPAPLTLFVKGTNFQVQVWRALLQIPFGEVATYQMLATAIGRPTAARAVGHAIAANPVGYFIPCHRVIRASGELGGYRWGGDRKAALLGWEAGQLTATQDSGPDGLGEA